MRVLLIEDSADDAEIVLTRLRREGLSIEATRAWTADHIGQLLSEKEWDAVLSDYSLPGWTAHQALEMVRQHDPNLPFILVSGTVDPTVAVQLMREGMHEYVQKEDLARLAPALEREVRDARHRRNEIAAMRLVQKSEQQFRETFEQTAVGMSHVDTEGRYLRTNRRFAQMLGYDPEELRGKHYSLFTHPDDLQAEKEFELSTSTGSAQLHLEKRYLRQDGSTIWVLLTKNAVRDESGDVKYFVSITQDITEQKRAQQEREELQKQIQELTRLNSLGQLAGKMAHEFNNVLMGILPFSEVLRRTSRDPKAIEAARMIANSVRRGQRVSREILQYARPMAPSRKCISVNDYLVSLQQILAGVVRSNANLQVDLCRCRPACSISIDPEQLSQVFTNLVINACDAMPDGGTIRLREEDAGQACRDFILPRTERFVHLVVEDEGEGIPEEYLSRVFEPMFTRKPSGTGLGLAVSHQIVTAHGGYIFARSQVGKGSAFHLFLPVIDDDEVQERQRQQIGA